MQRLLLTSAGITNKAIATALRELVGKPFSQTHLAFLPTAANVGGNTSERLVNDLVNFIKLDFKTFDIVDISSVPQAEWQPRLERADIVVFGGGNIYHLIYCIEKAGITPLLQQWSKTKVYVGISSGSVIFTKDLALSRTKNKDYIESIGEHVEKNTLGYVDFYIRPHLNNPDFPHQSTENIQQLAEKFSDVIYAIDDNTALQIIDEKLTVISEGKWKKFN